MREKQVRLFIAGLVLLGGLGSTISVSVADAAGATASADGAASRGRGANGFLTLLQRKVGLTPEQLDGVKGLLSAQRQQMSSIREQTDSKIRALLTAQQQPKFDATLTELKSRRKGAAVPS